MQIHIKSFIQPVPKTQFLLFHKSLSQSKENSTEQGTKHAPSLHMALKKVFPSHQTHQATGSCPFLCQSMQAAHPLRAVWCHTPQWQGQRWSSSSRNEDGLAQTKHTTCYIFIAGTYPHQSQHSSSSELSHHTAQPLVKAKGFTESCSSIQIWRIMATGLLSGLIQTNCSLAQYLFPTKIICWKSPILVL